MKSYNKTKLIALILTIAGSIICLGTMVAAGFDFSKFDNSVYVENTYEFDVPIQNLSIDLDYADISILPSKSSKTKVVCFEKEDYPHTAKVKNDTLSITKKDAPWFRDIFTFKKIEITVYLPEKSYTSISIDNTTGDTFIDSINAQNIKIECSTGDVTLSDLESADVEIETTTGNTEFQNVTAHRVESEVTTGDIAFINTVCSGPIIIEATTGDISFEYSDADTITAETSTGDIIGTILTAKTFYTETSTGDVDVPRTTGNICELETSTGNIRISIAE